MREASGKSLTLDVDSHVLIDEERMERHGWFEMCPLEERDAARYERALRELDEGEHGYDGIVYCRAFDGDDEVGNLVIDAGGKILGRRGQARAPSEGHRNPDVR